MGLSFDPAALMAPGGIMHGLDDLGSAVVNALNRKAERKYQEDKDATAAAKADDVRKAEHEFQLTRDKTAFDNRMKEIDAEHKFKSGESDLERKSKEGIATTKADAATKAAATKAAATRAHAGLTKDELAEAYSKAGVNADGHFMEKSTYTDALGDVHETTKPGNWSPEHHTKFQAAIDAIRARKGQTPLESGAASALRTAIDEADGTPDAAAAAFPGAPVATTRQTKASAYANLEASAAKAKASGSFSQDKYNAAKATIDAATDETIGAAVAPHLKPPASAPQKGAAPTPAPGPRRSAPPAVSSGPMSVADEITANTRRLVEQSRAGDPQRAVTMAEQVARGQQMVADREAQMRANGTMPNPYAARGVPPALVNPFETAVAAAQQRLAPPQTNMAPVPLPELQASSLAPQGEPSWVREQAMQDSYGNLTPAEWQQEEVAYPHPADASMPAIESPGQARTLHQQILQARFAHEARQRKYMRPGYAPIPNPFAPSEIY